jgi:hypothetical protein
MSRATGRRQRGTRNIQSCIGNDLLHGMKWVGFVDQKTEGCDPDSDGL